MKTPFVTVAVAAALASASAAVALDDLQPNYLHLPKVRSASSVPAWLNVHNGTTFAPDDFGPAPSAPVVDANFAELQLPQIGDSVTGRSARGSLPRAFLGMDYYGPEAFDQLR